MELIYLFIIFLDDHVSVVLAGRHLFLDTHYQALSLSLLRSSLGCSSQFWLGACRLEYYLFTGLCHGVLRCHCSGGTKHSSASSVSTLRAALTSLQKCAFLTGHLLRSCPCFSIKECPWDEHIVFCGVLAVALVPVGFAEGWSPRSFGWIIRAIVRVRFFHSVWIVE